MKVPMVPSTFDPSHPSLSGHFHRTCAEAFLCARPRVAADPPSSLLRPPTSGVGSTPSGLEQLPPGAGRLVQERADVVLGRAEVHDRHAHRRAALQDGRREEERSRADEAVDDLPVEAVEVGLGELATGRAVAEADDRQHRLGEELEVVPLAHRVGQVTPLLLDERDLAEADGQELAGLRPAHDRAGRVGRAQDAEADLLKQIEVAPFEAWSYETLAGRRTRQRRFTEAADFFARAAAAEPKTVGRWVDAGWG